MWLIKQLIKPENSFLKLSLVKCTLRPGKTVDRHKCNIQLKEVTCPMQKYNKCWFPYFSLVFSAETTDISFLTSPCLEQKLKRINLLETSRFSRSPACQTWQNMVLKQCKHTCRLRSPCLPPAFVLLLCITCPRVETILQNWLRCSRKQSANKRQRISSFKAPSFSSYLLHYEIISDCVFASEFWLSF